MKLDFNEIKSITSGAVRIWETQEGISFNRFTEEQEEYIRGYSELHHEHSVCAAGIVMRFLTDSSTLFLKALLTPGRFFPFDVVVNGKLLELSGFSESNAAIINFEQRFELGDGEKTVEIYFSFNRKVILRELSLSDGSFIKPIKREKKMLVYGDSITQGYNASHPCERYAARMTEYLGAEEICKAISGDIFRPATAAFKDELTPDIISVAYGTNDWAGGRVDRPKEEIVNSCREFCENLRRNYPDAPMLVITPVWRKDSDTPRISGNFEELIDHIEEGVRGIEGVTVIRGRNFIPEDETLFGDLRLHPNSKGFKHYSDNLVKELKRLGF